MSSGCIKAAGRNAENSVVIRFLAALLLGMLIMPAAQAQTADVLWENLPVPDLEAIEEETGVSFEELAKQAMAGDPGKISEWTSEVWEAFCSSIRSYWLHVSGILCMACITGWAGLLSGERQQARRAMGLLCRLAIAAVLMTMMIDVFHEATSVVFQVRRFMDAIAPVLTAALALTGATGTSAVLPASVALADQAVMWISTEYGLPLLKVAAALSVVAGLNGGVRLERLFRLSVGVVKWMLGCCMTGFLAFIGAQNALLNAKNGIAVQTTRFVVDNLLPIVGGELSDTVGSVFASAVLVKNAAGIAVCGMIGAIILIPIARLAGLLLLVRVTAAGADIMAVDEIPTMLDRFAQVVEVLLATLAVAAALGIILAGMVVSASGARG